MIDNKLKQRFIQNIEDQNFDEALFLANECSLAHPDDPDGYNMVADVFRLKGDYVLAHKFYSISLLKNNKQVQILLMLGEVNILLGQINDADVLFCDALELAPEDPLVLNKCGVYYLGKGEIESSEFLLKRAIELGYLAGYGSLLELYVFIQDKKNIEILLKQHYSHLPIDSLAIAKGYLQLKHYQQSLQYLESIDVSLKTDPWKRSYYQLLGFTFEKLNNYSAAFNAFEKQNNSSNYVYSHDSAKKYNDQLFQSIQSSDNGLKYVVKENKDEVSPLFILGTPRSGSSLIEQILNANKHVALGGELSFIASAFQSWQEKTNDSSSLANWYREKLKFYIDSKDQDIKWVSDKMPANWQYIGFILKLFPDAKIIYTKRNVMDIGLSIYKQNMVSAHPYATQLENIAHHIYLVETTMEKWMNLYPDRILMVEYESIVTCFKSETKKIMQFLGLKWKKELAHFYNNEHITLTASREQVRKPLYKDSIQSYKRYGEKLDALKNTLNKYNVKII